MIFLFTLMAQAPVLEDTGLSFGWLFLKTIIAMVIVIVLAFVFIQVGRKIALIGTSDNSVNKIMDLEEKDLEERC